MRILGLSDSHGHVCDVQRVRDLEQNRFDVVVVAGDIDHHPTWEYEGRGGGIAWDVGIYRAIVSAARWLPGSIDRSLEILATFDCPTAFVLGNHDSHIDHERVFGPAHLLDRGFVQIEGWTFVGFSGCRGAWGKNPIAALEEDELRGRHAATLAAKGDPLLTERSRRALQPALDAYRRDRMGLDRRIEQAAASRALAQARSCGSDPSRVAFVSHASVIGIRQTIPGLGLHLFGHKHGFSHGRSLGTSAINVSALDATAGIQPLWEARCPHLGQYCVIEIDNEGVCTATPHRLWPDGFDDDPRNRRALEEARIAAFLRKARIERIAKRRSRLPR